MKKILISFILILVIKTSSYCQEIYPKEAIVNNDTVICIDESQLKEINATFEENKAYSIIIDSSEAIINRVNIDIINTKKTFQEYAKLTVLLNEQLKTTNDKVVNAEQNIKLLQEELKQQRGKTIKIAVLSSFISFSAFTTVYFILK